MKKAHKLHENWQDSPAYRKAYNELEQEFSLAQALIAVRAKAGLTQEELAKRMDTTQSVIARLEAGRTRPSTKTLERLAKATRTRLVISFESYSTPDASNITRPGT
jgi:transcriptional regulator with XRE-family HTH domain